jgi:hypothetical protein
MRGELAGGGRQILRGGGVAGRPPRPARAEEPRSWRRPGRRSGPARPARALIACLVFLPAALALTVARAAQTGAAAASDSAGTAAGGSDDSAGTAAAAATAVDPVVGQVLQMLREGIGEPVIVLWLDQSGKRPAAVGSADLVALHQAGASDGLLKKLIELARVPASAPAPAASAAPPGSGPATSPAGAAAHPATGPATATPPPAAKPASPAPAPAAGEAAPSAPAPASAPSAAGSPAAATAPAAPAAVPAAPAAAAASSPSSSSAASSGAMVKVRFAVTYRPVLVEEEVASMEPWLLCLYVDGRFVASVNPGSPLLPLPARTFDRELAPGKHLLRVTQERHLRRARGRAYESASRIDPSELPFELQPAAAAEIAIRFNEKSRKHPGPIAVRVEQDGKELARLEPPAANPEAWPALCEDVLAALPPASKPSGEVRRQLASCVHWAALWPGVLTLPSRDEVRGEIERQGRSPGGGTD